MMISRTPVDVVNNHHYSAINDRQKLDRVIAELIVDGSIELSAAQDLHTLGEAQALLPTDMGVYIASLPKQTLMSRLERMRAVHAVGYDPVPHLAARQIPSRPELRQFLNQAVRECGVHRVLLIGGDVPNPAGPYVDAAAVLREGILAELGIREVGLAGYPEGHPRIPARTLDIALEEKLKLAGDQGLGTYIVTQFSFAPLRIVEYCARLAHAAPELPIYIGMPGPTSPTQLIRYARICGVSTSLRALIDLGFKAARLIHHTAPDEQLTVLAHYCAARTTCNVVGVHVYSFGGFFKSAQWMHRMYTQSKT
jgi:methylenetetrahydrofolate reductase (NADPH)